MEGTWKADKCSFLRIRLVMSPTFIIVVKNWRIIRQKSIRSFSVDEILRLPTAKMDDRLAIFRSYKKYF
jgi:hypothetical protein